MIILIFLILINEALVELISKSLLLANFREFFMYSDYPILKFIGDAVSCGYCCSFWTAMFLVLISGFTLDFFISNIFILNAFINFVFSVLIIQRCSNYLHGLSDRFFSTSKDVRYQA